MLEIKKKYLSTGQLARRCGVATITVKRWIESGALAAYQFGTAYRISIADAEAFVNNARTIKKKQLPMKNGAVI